jgi:hypothetical protein
MIRIKFQKNKFHGKNKETRNTHINILSKKQGNVEYLHR